MARNTEERYTIQNRLNDVITLISALALMPGTGFSKERDLSSAIRKDKPFSIRSWFELVDAHPEFFRRNGERDHAALIMRSYHEEKHGKDQKPYREALTIAETQKLIDAAISLHDKELARHQRNAFKIPVKTALISGAFLLGISLLNSSIVLYTNHTNNRDIDSLKFTLKRIETKVDKSHQIPKLDTTRKLPTVKKTTS